MTELKAQGPQHEHAMGKGIEVPGEQKGMKRILLEKGASLAQRFGPVNAIHDQFCGIHFYCGELHRQVIAYHYCCHLNEDLAQCVIYDSDKPDAKLIGVEYIISRKLYETLPEDERKLWHSHVYEVKSGLLMGPGIPGPAEDAFMKDLMNTYGKTFHFWEIDKGHKLPLGIPKLMGAFTADGQVDERLVQQRDEYLQLSTAESRKRREGFAYPEVHKDADSWFKGEVKQLELKKL